MTKYRYFIITIVVVLLSACDYQEPVPATSTPRPPKTDTPIPTSTPSPVPPTATVIPSPTVPADIWLDTNAYELLVEHPASTEQAEWESGNEITVPAEGNVGGFIFTVDDVSGIWAPAQSLNLPEGSSIMRSASMRENLPGQYCVSDYFSNYNPLSICQWLAPGSTQLDWITPYFAGPKTEIGIAFHVGGCDPSSCTAYLRVSNIRLIYFALPE